MTESTVPNLTPAQREYATRLFVAADDLGVLVEVTPEEIAYRGPWSACVKLMDQVPAPAA